VGLIVTLPNAFGGILMFIKIVVALFVVSFLFISADVANAPAYPIIDECTQALMGEAYWHAAWYDCVSTYPGMGCGGYGANWVAARAAVDRVCQIQG
jgi:hypothetical protein